MSTPITPVSAVILKLLVATLLATVGFYYVKNARKLSGLFYERARRFKPPFSWIFPSRLYKSKYFIAMLSLSGFGALLGAIVFLATIVLDLLRI